MLEMLRQIPGPLFLLYYGVLIFLGIVLGRRWVNADGSGNRALPDYAHFSPLSIAMLRGGINEVIRTAVFHLTEKKLIIMDAENRLEVSTEKSRTSSADLHPLERELLKHIDRENKLYPDRLFRDPGLLDKLERHIAPIQQELERFPLLRSQEEQKRARVKKAALIAALLALGLVKLFLGITHNRPITFLVILLIVSAILLFVLLNVSVLTNLGKRYLDGMAAHFAWLKDEFAQGRKPDGINPALVVALFGVSAVMGVAQYQALANVFPSRTTSSTDTSYGCGGSSGCSGSSGSDGGGGGCGGCGGGGGD